MEVLRGFGQAHVVFLHEKFTKCPEDQYLLDMAVSLERQGHIVSIYTSETDENNCINEMIDVKCKLRICYSGWWVPSSWKCFRSAVMAFRMSVFPPSPPPTIVIMDINTIAIYVLTILRNFKLIYIPDFSSLKHAERFSKHVCVKPDLITMKALKHAHEIIVPSEGHAEVFRRSYPLLCKPLRILYPCVDTGAWRTETIDILRIIPDLERPSFLFICFGAYKKHTHFKMILHALEDLFMISPPQVRSCVRLVIAGNSSELSPDQAVYYNELLDYTKEQSYASNVTFIRQLSTVIMKTLISVSSCVLIPSKHDLAPNIVLAVMASKKPIIATNSGFAKEVLRHRYSALLVEQTPQLFAAAMYKVITNRGVQVFVAARAQEQFLKKYSNLVFHRKINAIIQDNIELPLLALDETVENFCELRGIENAEGDHINNDIVEEEENVDNDDVDSDTLAEEYIMDEILESDFVAELLAETRNQ